MAAVLFASVGLDRNVGISDNGNLSVAILNIGGAYSPFMFARGLVSDGFLGLALAFMVALNFVPIGPVIVMDFWLRTGGSWVRMRSIRSLRMHIGREWP